MSLIEMNHITDTDALQGADEAAAFVNGEFIKLQQSTLRKVDVLSNIFDRTHDKGLKTNASFTDKYGIHPVALIEVAKNNIFVTSAVSLTTLVAATLKWKDIVGAFQSLF